MQLPLQRREVPDSAIGRWLAGPSIDPTAHDEPQSWPRVLWLTGVDYFSTLGYQPGIALLAAGALSPIATLLVVAVTLFGALPTYAQVARRSYGGQGSIAMLEHLLPGWVGKSVVLGLLGFAATDFVITVTLSAADAAKHLVENPWLHPHVGGAEVSITLLLLLALAAVFLRGFREAIGIAMLAGIPYLALNAIVIGRGLLEIARHPELSSAWSLDVATRGDWTVVLLAAGLVFPRLALGMSGFETGVSVMPLVEGGPGDRGAALPAGRIRATRKLLAAAALVMSAFLLGSSFVTALLVPPSAYAEGGPAAGRAIAYLAHEYLGPAFGTVYDASTIIILWFAGASATAGLLHLIPRYLPRFGMAPNWVARARPLVLILLGIQVLVTLAFRADVEAQAGAYATGVLVLMLSAAVAVALAFAQERRRFGFLAAGYFALVSVAFGFTLVENVVLRPDGLVIASLFVLAIILLSAVSRLVRATELRVEEIALEDAESEKLWTEISGKKVNLVPLKTGDETARARKAEEIRRHYSVRGPLAFVHVELVDDRSEFFARLRMRVRKVGSDYAIEVRGAVAIANTIAITSELVDPISIFLGLSRLNLMRQAFHYLFWGEGEVGLLVYTILVRYWEWTAEDDVRPLIFLFSE